MARLVINTIGSTGDLFPFVALGRALKLRGHDVVFAVSETMLPTLRKAGLDGVKCGAPIGEQAARERVEVFEGSDPRRQLKIFFREFLIPQVPENYRDLLAACKGADALIATTIQMAAEMVHEKSGIPWITVSLSPSQFPSAYESPPNWPRLGLFKSHFLRRLGWRAARAFLYHTFARDLNRIRADLGFRPITHAPAIEGFSKELTLLASSRHFTPPRPDWESSVKMTGFWYYDQDESGWEPSAELKAFMEGGGEKPIFMSLGSMVQKDPTGVVKMHVEAAKRLGRRILIQEGWAKLDVACVPQDVKGGHVLGIGFVPHDWIFQNAAAVIHHGGAGTTARALRHGCPMLIETHGFDQPFNGRIINELGAGEYIGAHEKTTDRIEKLLRRVLSAETSARAARIGTEVRKEDGTRTACELIEECLSVRAPVPSLK
jgi:UDP:flavonoid glycosyltransferase YjiC (YdhE family)